MLKLTLKNHSLIIPRRIYGYSVKRFLPAVVAVVGVSLLILTLLIFAKGLSSSANAVSYTSTPTTYDQSNFGTEKLINDFKNAGYDPAVSVQVNRKPFSVMGSLIVLDKDNLQAFEYKDSESALREAQLFKEKYMISKKPNPWKSQINLYVRDRVVVFYMGTAPNILSFFEGYQRISLSE